MHVLPIFYIKKLFFNGANLVSGSKSLWPDWEHVVVIRRVWIYQRGNQNPYIEEEQTTQWPKEKVHKDKQRSTKHTYKTKDRVTRTPLKTGSEFNHLQSHNSGMKNWNFIKKYTNHKTINSNNYVKFEVNWPRGSQFTARHTKNRLQFDE
jgi:hypothetical protein